MHLSTFMIFFLVCVIAMAAIEIVQIAKLNNLARRIESTRYMENQNEYKIRDLEYKINFYEIKNNKENLKEL